MEPHFDYLRLATWVINDYLFTTANLLRQHQWKHAGWLQYKGRRSDDGRLFFGVGEQNRRRHSIIQLSGGLAEEKQAEWMTWPASFYCTRLDLQVTILEPKEHDPDELYERLQRKAKSIVKSPGTATIYLGARTSDLFTRIYEKPLAGKRFLRCEFELKGKYARSAFLSIRTGMYSKEKLYQQCLNQSRVPKPYAEWFRVNGDESGGLEAAEKSQSLAATKTWLDNTEIGIMRLLGHEETRGMAISFIEELKIVKRFADET